MVALGMVVLGMVVLGLVQVQGQALRMRTTNTIDEHYNMKDQLYSMMDKYHNVWMRTKTLWMLLGGEVWARSTMLALAVH